jgi:hypothetical protein
MLKRSLIVIATLGSVLCAGAAAAAGASASASAGPIPVNGTVTTFCSTGALSNDTSVFDLGVLTDPNTGLLRNDVAAVSKTLNGATCNALSTITVAAQPMTAQAFTSEPPQGFSRSVDYTATASGWTVTPAVYMTSAAQNPGASQSRNTPFTGPITLTLSNFSTTGGSNLRLVSDPVYSGAITVTLTAGD